VTFRKAIRGKLLVVRGCTGCIAQVSSDGRQFATAGTEPFGSSDTILVVPLTGALVRAVRIQTDTGGFFDSLREVSVWATSQQVG
jgi:hypothetical protein